MNLLLTNCCACIRTFIYSEVPTTYVYVYAILLVCIHVFLGDHGAPPAAPSDDITYIPHTARRYALSINLTTAPLEIAYIVRLTTNATNTTSYFIVSPVCVTGILVSCYIS